MQYRTGNYGIKLMIWKGHSFNISNRKSIQGICFIDGFYEVFQHLNGIRIFIDSIYPVIISDKIYKVPALSTTCIKNFKMLFKSAFQYLIEQVYIDIPQQVVEFFNTSFQYFQVFWILIKN